jgi:hypothetical protein
VLLMLAGFVRDKDFDPEGPRQVSQVVTVRFFDSEVGVKKTYETAKRFVRKAFPDIDPKTITWDVYEPKTTRGGWPKWLGEVYYYL